MLKNRLIQLIMIILAAIGLIWGVNAVLIINVTGEALQTRLSQTGDQTAEPPPPRDLAGHCQAQGEEGILVIYEQTGKTPVVQFVYIDYQLPSLSILTLPDDLSVISQLLPEDQPQPTTLARAHEYLIETYRDDPNQQAIIASLLAQILFENLHITADHYLVLHQNAFQIITDMLGGVQMNLPYPLPVPGTDLMLDPGLTILTGAYAHQLASFSPTGMPEGDQLDMERLMLLSRGILQQMEANGGQQISPHILSALNGSLVTDMKAATLDQARCALAFMPNQSIQLSAPPADWFARNMMQSETP